MRFFFDTLGEVKSYKPETFQVQTDLHLKARKNKSALSTVPFTIGCYLFLFFIAPKCAGGLECVLEFLHV